METLETMSTTQFLYRLALSMLAAMVIIGITAEIIGEERKHLVQEKNEVFILLRRGFLGENSISATREPWKGSACFWS